MGTETSFPSFFWLGYHARCQIGWDCDTRKRGGEGGGSMNSEGIEKEHVGFEWILNC